MALRPKLLIDAELSFYQLGESWQLVVSLEDAELAGQEVAPTSGTVTILGSGGNTLVASTAMTLAGTALTYTMASTVITVPERSCQAKVTLVETGGTWTYMHLFDVVRFAARMPLSEADLAVAVPALAALVTQSDLTGGGILRMAWEDVLGYLRAMVKYPDLVLDHQELKRGLRLRALQLLYLRASMEPGDSASKSAELWGEQWKEWKESTKLVVDIDNSGTVEEEERQRSMSVVTFGRVVAASDAPRLEVYR